MRTIAFVLLAAAAGAPRAHADDPWLDFQGGLQHHAIRGGSTDLDAGKELTMGLAADVPMGEHLALRGQMAYVRTGGAFALHGVRQELDIDLLDLAVLLKLSARFGYGDQLYVLAGPALGFRTNTPDTLYGPVDIGPPYPLEVAEGWRRVAVSAVFGGGFAIRPRGGRVGTFFEAQYRRGLNDLYAAPDPSPFAYDPVDRSHGWRFVTGLSIAVR
jgi:hypothetical protein